MESDNVPVKLLLGAALLIAAVLMILQVLTYPFDARSVPLDVITVPTNRGNCSISPRTLEMQCRNR